MSERLDEATAARIRSEYPSYLVDDISRALESYGRGSHEREPSRVRIAILDLAGGDAGELAYLIRVAKTDHRDVLMWRDNPASPEDVTDVRHSLRKLGIELGKPLVPIRYYKGGGRPHWRFDVEHAGEDLSGVWFRGAAGTRADRGFEDPISFSHAFALVIPRDAWWTLSYNAAPDEIEFYGNVIMPLEWRGRSPAMVDLDLDVIALRDGRVIVDDEDEFEDHRVVYGYPEVVVEKARETAGLLVRMLTDCIEPFREASAGLLSEARD